MGYTTQPEMLKYLGSGYMSRRILQEYRVVGPGRWGNFYRPGFIRAVSRLGYVLVGTGAAPAKLAPARIVERAPLNDFSALWAGTGPAPTPPKHTSTGKPPYDKQ